MNRNTMRRKIEPALHIRWQLEHAHEHRRHPLAVRHTMPFDEIERECRVELFHDDRSTAERAEL